jgi:hypothetical protein
MFDESEEANETNAALLFPKIQQKYVCVIDEKNVIIKLNTTTGKDILLDIKKTLESCPRGEYHVWVDIGEQRVDTKIYI